MRNKSENLKSNNLIKILFLLIITTSVVTTLSLSKFEKQVTGIGETSVARFAVKSIGKTTVDLTLDPNTTDNKVSYSLAISNRENNKTSEVDIKFDVIVKLPKPLASGLTMKLSGKTGTVSSDGLTYTFKDAGTFTAGSGLSRSFSLAFTADYDLLSYDVYSGIKVLVYAEQID